MFATYTSQLDVAESFNNGAARAPAPLRRIVNVAGPLQQGIAAAQSIFQIIDMPLEDKGGDRALGRARRRIECHQRTHAVTDEVGVRDAVMEQVRARLSPEFINRIGLGNQNQAISYQLLLNNSFHRENWLCHQCSLI